MQSDIFVKRIFDVVFFEIKDPRPNFLIGTAISDFKTANGRILYLCISVYKIRAALIVNRNAVFEPIVVSGRVQQVVVKFINNLEIQLYMLIGPVRRFAAC